MCDSIAEGGRRCTGRHLTIEQHTNRAERRRAADRERKAGKRATTCDVPRPDPLHPSQRAWIESNHACARAVRAQMAAAQLPPEGMWDAEDLRNRGIPLYMHGELGKPHGTNADMYGEYPYWTEAHVRDVETTNPRITEHLAASIKTPETKALANEMRKQQRIAKTVSKTAARTAQRKADDEMAKAAGHPYGKDAEIRRLATPAVRDRAAEGTPVFVSHDGDWKVLMPYADAWIRRIQEERFPVTKANGTESLQRVLGVTEVGAHNGVLMGLADVSTSPGPQEQAEIDAKEAAEATQRAAAEAARRAAISAQHAAEKAQREAEREDARQALQGKANGDDISWAGAVNVQGVADGSRPTAVWSKTDRGEWVVIAREDEVEGAGIADTGTNEYQVGVHKRGQRHTEPFRGYVIGRAEVDGVKVAVLSKDDPNATHRGCYSCGGPGPLDEYGYCGC